MLSSSVVTVAWRAPTRQLLRSDLGHRCEQVRPRVRWRRCRAWISQCLAPPTPQRMSSRLYRKMDGAPTPAYVQQALTTGDSQTGANTALVPSGLGHQRATQTMPAVARATTAPKCLRKRSQLTPVCNASGCCGSARKVSNRLTDQFPFPPSALADGSARTMLRAVAFPWLIHRLTQDALLCLDATVMFETLLIALAQCFDAASVNLCFDGFTVKLYAAMNRALNFSVTVLTASIKCAAHQINLASLAGLSCDGCGSTTAEKQIFIARFVGVANTFGQSVYIIRVWHGCLKFLARMRVLTVSEAIATGVPIASEFDHKFKVALLSYLLKWVTGKRVLSDRLAQAVETVCMYLNSTLAHWLTPGEIPVHILMPGNTVSFQQFVDAFHGILNRVCRVSRLGRWTSYSPSFACQGM